jgi:hypothetical protein
MDMDGMNMGGKQMKEMPGMDMKNKAMEGMGDD